MLKMFKYLTKRNYLSILLVACLIVGQVYIDLTIPTYTGELTKMLSSGTASMEDTWKNVGIMIALSFLSLLLAITTGFLTSRISASIAKNLRMSLFEKITSFSSFEMNQFSTPSLITRTTNDVVRVQNFFAMGITLLIKAPVTAIWAICKVSASNTRWTVAVIIAVASIVTIVSFIVIFCLPRFRRIQKLTDDLNEVTRENVAGVRVIRAFNADEYQENKFENVNNTITSINTFVQKVSGLLMPAMTIAMNVLTIAIYWIGADLINSVNGTDPYATLAERAAILGDMSVFTQYVMQIIMSFMMLIFIFIILPRVMVCAKRINEVMDTKISIKNGNNTEDTKQGTIEFKHVSFGFKKDSPVLSDITFSVNKGETVAIIGATGSGKTSIVNLIPRFYDVTSGEILVNGINVKDYDEGVLRSKIAIATQKAVLFKGSVSNNITYGIENKDEEKMKRAIDIANADFIYDLENGLEHEIAQGGTNLSGGQKQRVSIARTIYKDSEIMIFDDTFSALDYKTDMLVRKKIHENLTDKTVIIVAQRIGTVKNANKIIVLDEGKIVGIGTHEELLESSSVYQEIALSQLAKEEL